MRTSVVRAVRPRHVIAALIYCLLALGAYLVHAAHLASTTTPARQRLKELLTAYNAGERSALLAFRDDHVSWRWEDAPAVDDVLQYWKRNGGFEELKTRNVSATILYSFLRSRDSDDVFIVDMTVERYPPHRVIAVTLDPGGSAASDYWPVRLSIDAAVADMRAHLAQRDRAGLFSGAMLFARGARVLIREAHGFANREARIPLTIATRFHVGAMTNMFTATAMLRLVQEGRLSTSQTVGEVLPELADRPCAKVTLGQLLANTGGTGMVRITPYMSQRDGLRNHLQFVREFALQPLLFRAGTRFAYSNYGFALLGAVIERATGRSYDDYVRDVVFRPAGMQETIPATRAEPRDGAATAYRRVPGSRRWVAAPHWQARLPTAVEGHASTIDDLFRFANALLSHSLLDERHTSLLLSPRTSIGAGQSYAYGFSTEPYGKSGQWAGHRDAGLELGLADMSGELMFDAATGYVIVTLSNFEAPAATHASRHLAARLPLRE
jgi:CubicO group peptidase (beta-lactamase class C family)